MSIMALARIDKRVDEILKALKQPGIDISIVRQLKNELRILVSQLDEIIGASVYRSASKPQTMH